MCHVRTHDTHVTFLPLTLHVLSMYSSATPISHFPSNRRLFSPRLPYSGLASFGRPTLSISGFPPMTSATCTIGPGTRPTRRRGMCKRKRTMNYFRDVHSRMHTHRCMRACPTQEGIYERFIYVHSQYRTLTCGPMWRGWARRTRVTCTAPADDRPAASKRMPLTYNAASRTHNS
jgi:hypothetical protein